MGYPVRRDFKEFLQRYRCLAKATVKAHTDLCQDLEKQKLLIKGEYQIGNTKVFMRTEQANILEGKREASLVDVVAKIQKVVRGWLERTRYKMFSKILKDLASATKAKDEAKLENALQNVGKLPYLGNHIPTVQKAKETLAHVKESKKVLKMIEDAIAQRDMNAINSALKAAKEIGLSDPLTQKAEALKSTIEKERGTKDLLEKAIASNKADDLKKALAQAQKMKMMDHPAAKDAASALDHIEKESKALKALEAAIKKGDNAAVIANLTIMAELGNTEHPLVKKGQEVSKQMAKASKETEAKMKEVERLLKNAVADKDLGALKELNPQVIMYGIKGAVVEEAKALMRELQAKEEKFSELAAVMHAVEVKASSYDGITAADVKGLSDLLAQAKKMGYKDDDDEIQGIKDFQARMQAQVEAHGLLKKALDSGDDKQLKKAMDTVQELGLETGLAQKVREAVGLYEMEQAEANLEKAAALTEKIKKELKESTEDDRSDEKLALMEKKTKAHQKLVADASDTKYDFQKYYKIREDSDYLEYVPSEAKQGFGDRKLKSQTKLIPKSLLQLPQAMSKTAIQVHKSILQYCGDLANPYPNTMARFMIVTALEQPGLVDEIYCQLMKHVVENNRPVSEDRGWGLLCMATSAFPPSPEFAPFVVNFCLNNRTRGGLIGNYAKLCIVQLDGRIRLGATKLLPDLKVIDTYSQRPPILAIIQQPGDKDPLEIPVTPDEDLDAVFNDAIYPITGISESEQIMYGLFVIDGKPKNDRSLKQRLTLFYKKHNPAKLVHVDYFVASWSGNDEALFHTLTKKYGPEPTAAEAEALERGNKGKEKKNLLVMSITAAKNAGKRLGFVSDQKELPSPQHSWALPWWVFPGDVFLRMVKQGVEPVFTFKRKLFKKGEKASAELVDQVKMDFVNGDQVVPNFDEAKELITILLAMRNGAKAPKDAAHMLDLGLKEVTPIDWLSQKTPQEIAEACEACLSSLGSNAKQLNDQFWAICQKQITFGMSLFSIYDEKSQGRVLGGVDPKGFHLVSETGDQVLTTFVYRNIKEFGATQSYFWMKVIEPKAGKEETVYLPTIQAWDIYALVYDYTHNAQLLNL
uniref:MyTH4 domain-containing protein n=1 Tax=Aplanochytrium stocchinoi TaxID=215587 RepID=A0A7S3PLT8_9STRA